ncbi:MAG: hypothetical protein ACK4E3_08935 [Brevundimonas sp.]|uniref:hypothetical protein n=1 Tax=Brevundimonas sp. TaxID=1871086 RepID=UPI00391BF19B
MRSVAKFKLVHPNAQPKLFDEVAAMLQTWFAGKFERDDEGGYRFRRDGRPAIAAIAQEDVEGSRLLRVRVTEDIIGGKLTTQAALLSSDNEVRFTADLGVVATGVSRPTVALRAPRFVHDVIGTGTAWHVENGRDRVFSSPFPVGTSNVKLFKDLILSEDRALPVIAISKIDDHVEFPDLAGNLARRISALAHVCVLDQAASWDLTDSLGEQWSCYNGAVRIYWPGGVGRGLPFRHTLWRADRVLARYDTLDDAQKWLDNTITRRVIEASSYVSDDQAFVELEERRAASRIEFALKKAIDDADYQQLADVYAEENDALRARNKELKAQIENAEAELIGLRAAYYRGDLGADAAEIEETEAPPATVSEAVGRATQAFASDLEFADTIKDSVATLSATAGPPGKIMDYLQALNELSIALEEGKGNIGKTIPIWLRGKGIECSGESETVKNSRSEKAARTFRINGIDVHCELHLKPSDGTHPDKCARIYFAISQSRPRVKIGYVGRHF